MGRKGPLEFVTPEEFKARTSLRLHSRSGTTVTMDRAYENYYAVRSPIAKDMLYRAMQEYMIAHGGYWNRCERNVVSGGLLKWIYDELAPPSVQRTIRADPGLDDRAAHLINAHDIPHSRYGVLYLLGNIKIEPDIFSLVLEGVATVGSTVGHSLTTDFSHVNNLNSSVTVGSVHGHSVSGRAVTTGGAGAVTVVGTLAGSSGSVTAKPPPTGDPKSWFPCTERAIEAASTSISDAFDQRRYFAGAAMVTGAALAAPVVLTATVLADAGLAVVRAARALWEKLTNLFTSVAASIKSKMNDRMFVGRSLGALIKAIVKIAVDVVLKNAVPFLAGAMDMGTGLIRAIDATATRIATWMDRRQITVVPGHPEEIANSIEHSMTVGIFKGLGDILKGGAKTAVAILAPGLGSVAAAAMGALEWLVKVIVRIVESEHLKTFLAEARALFLTEKARAQLEPSPGHGSDGMPVRGDMDPHIDGTGFICDTAAFTEFFRKGCSASPLIPMLTLNSGICGSLMTMVKLFDDHTGALLAVPGAKRQPFDIGGDYFRRLKTYGVEYLQNSGFIFSPLDLENDAIRGLLNHATGKARQVMVDGKPSEMRSHVPPQTWGNAALAAIKA